MKKLAMLSLVLTVLATLFALSAAAQEPNLLGLYFDTDAESACAEGVIPYTIVTQYLVLSNPTMDWLRGIECGISVDGPVHSAGYWSPCAIETDPLTFSLGQIQFVCTTGLSAHLQHNVLLSLNWLYMGEDLETAFIELHDAQTPSLPTGTPLLMLQDGTLIPAAVDRLQYVPATSVITGMYDVCYPLANDEPTWGGLKALYK